MELPRLNSTKVKSKKYTYAFGGINRGESFNVGELEESENISFDCFPAISAGRAKESPTVTFRTGYEYIPVTGGAVAVKYDETAGLTLSYLEENKNSYLKGTTTFGTAAAGKREAARVGDYVVVFPDKVFLNPSSPYSGFKTMENTVEKETGSIGRIYYDSIKLASSSDYADFKAAFKVGDVVNVYAAWYYNNTYFGNKVNKKLIIREMDSSTYKIVFDSNSFPDLQQDSLELAFYEFKKEIPVLKNIVSYEGRLWGTDPSGKIYASKYNDPTNFDYFDNSSADSFTMETDTPGAFTASAGADAHVAFFKEDKIHRITGTKPSNFRHTVVYTNGVKSGAEKTLAEKDGILYYMGTDGVYTYGGAQAQRISDPLGQLSYESGAAVFYKDTYYISIKNSGGAVLYGYDTEKRMWLSDGDTEFINTAFKFMGESLYADSSGAIKKLGDGKDETRDISVTLREIEEDAMEQKGWSRLYISARLSEGDVLKAETDTGEGFETAGVFTDHRKTVFEIRLAPNRGDKIRIRLTASPKTVITRLMHERYVHGSVI